MSSDIHMTEEDAVSIVAFHTWAEALRRQGRLKEAWQQNILALGIINRSTLQALSSGAFDSDETLMYSETPATYPAPGQHKGISLTLLLIDGSPLAREVIDVLKKYQEALHE